MKKFTVIAILWVLVVGLVGCKASSKNIPDNSGEISSSTESTHSSEEESNKNDAVSQGEIVVPQMSKDAFPRLDGSTATLPLGRMLYRMSTGVTELDAAYDIAFTKTTSSYFRLMEKETDLVIAYEAGESAKEDSRYEDLLIKPIGLDALVFLCNEKNPIKSLTTEQIQGIYSGIYTNWKEVGGEDKEIIPFQRPENSGSQTLMENIMMQEVPLMEAPTEWQPGEMGDLVDSVASYDNRANALGYSVYYYAGNMYRVPGIRLMGVDEIIPNNNTIRNGDYQYTNPFYAAIRKDAKADSPEKLLFDWLTEADGQSLVNALGYVGIASDAKPLPKEFEIPTAEVHTGEKRLVIDASIYDGSAGVVVFDESLKPKKRISDIRISDGSSFVMARNNLILARTSLYSDGSELEDENTVGLYDIEKEEWVVAPEYGYGVLRVSDPDNLRYFLYTYDYSEEGAMDIVMLDAYGNPILGETVSEDEVYDAFRTVDYDTYTMEYGDTERKSIFMDRVVLTRYDAYAVDDTSDEFVELSIDGKTIEKADYGNIFPFEGVFDRADMYPYGYICVNLYDQVNSEEYFSPTNNRYILIDGNGDIVYKITMTGEEWLVMADVEYCLISDGEYYRIITPGGETVSSWRYSEYGEMEWEYMD